jgi:hypothetical protein
MNGQAMKRITPDELEDCARFINENREDIARGAYDIQIEKDWVRELPESDVLLVARSCPGSRLSVAQVTKSTDILRLLSEDDSGDVREAVADNPRTPAEVLTALSGDSASSVRMAVAENLKTPEASLERLATDKVNYVRWGVAHNESTPPAILKGLTKDPDKHVSDEAKQNPHTPKASWLGRLLGKG